MPDVVSNDELNALAAEYVLGTLDYEERKGATALLQVDATFRGIVRIWERRFGELHLMVEAVEPDAAVWARIRPQVPGIEQVPLALPSAADIPPPPASIRTLAAATPATIPAVEAAAAEFRAAAVAAEADVAGADAPGATDAPEAHAPAGERAPAETASAEWQPAEPPPSELPLAEAPPSEPEAAPAPAPEPQILETPPAEAETAEPAPVTAKDNDLKLAELAALLPVAAAAQERAGLHEGTPPAAEPMPEEGMHTHAPEEVPRGFVPPAPMIARGAPLVVEMPVPVKTGGRGWMATSLVMALVAVALAGLISAWRFFPERLPPQLRAYTVLNLAPPAPAAKAAPKKEERPKPPPFDE